MLQSKSDLYRADLHKACAAFDFSFLKGKAVFITGCNGLICSALTDLLYVASIEQELGITLLLATRSPEKTKRRFCFCDDKNVILVPYDAQKPFDGGYDADFYVLGAGNASPDLFVKNPVDTMRSNLFGLDEILKTVAGKKARVLYISSSEVYGNLSTKEPIKETECGFVELLEPHSSYAQAKRAAETLCASYSAQYDSNIVIARPGHVYGPTAGAHDRRVSSAFMYDAAAGKDLVLKSTGGQIRSYTYCIDCATALLTVLKSGAAGQAYNISNPRSICAISDMAQSFARSAGVRLVYDMPSEAEQKAFNPMSNSSLDSTKLERLGWKPLFTKEEGFEHTIRIAKALRPSENVL